MKLSVVVLAGILAFAACFVVIVQSNVIQQQRHLIQEMIKNPACLEPK